jgi:predicted nucleic acid-binding protein
MSRGPANPASLYLPGNSPKPSPTFRRSTTSNFEPISTPSSTRTLRLATGSNSKRGLADTSVAVDRDSLASVVSDIEIAISALTFAELLVGLHTASNDLMRARRRAHLLRIEGWIEALAFDVACARAWARIYAAVERIGRKPRGSRAIDLMIAATALAHDLPLYTLNPKDLRGLEDLVEVVDLG